MISRTTLGRRKDFLTCTQSPQWVIEAWAVGQSLLLCCNLVFSNWLNLIAGLEGKGKGEAEKKGRKWEKDKGREDEGKGKKKRERDEFCAVVIFPGKTLKVSMSLWLSRVTASLSLWSSRSVYSTVPSRESISDSWYLSVSADVGLPWTDNPLISPFSWSRLILMTLVRLSCAVFPNFQILYKLV